MKTRKKIAEIFGPKDPFEISTRVGFTGGGTTTLTSEGRTIKPDSKSEISWETFKLAIGYSRDADNYDLDGKWPKVEVDEPRRQDAFRHDGHDGGRRRQAHPRRSLRQRFQFRDRPAGHRRR